MVDFKLLPREEIERLKTLLEKATPQNFDTAEYRDVGEYECPLCSGDGSIEAVTYTNYDAVALGVQFFGIGPEHRTAEELIRALIPALPALLAEIEAGRAGAERVREIPVKHLSACGPFHARAMAWWAANMKSEAKAAFVTGDGYIRYHWDDGEESGSYSLQIACLYGLPHENATLRQAAQPSDGAPFVPQQLPMPKYRYQQDGDATSAAPAQVGAQPAGRVEEYDDISEEDFAKLLEILPQDRQTRRRIISSIAPLLRQAVQDANPPASGAVDHG